jgi:hypothetical protein
MAEGAARGIQTEGLRQLNKRPMGHFRTAPLPLKIAVAILFGTAILAIPCFFLLGDQAAIPIVLLMNLVTIGVLATRVIVGRPDLTE